MNRGLNFYAIILVTIATLVFSVNEFGVVHATTGIDLGNNPAQSNQVPDLKSDSNDNDDSNNNNDKSSNNNNDKSSNNNNDKSSNNNNDKSSNNNNDKSSNNNNDKSSNNNNDKSSNNNNDKSSNNNNDKSSKVAALPPAARTTYLWLCHLIQIWPMNPMMRRIIQV